VDFSVISKLLPSTRSNMNQRTRQLTKLLKYHCVICINSRNRHVNIPGPRGELIKATCLSFTCIAALCFRYFEQRLQIIISTYQPIFPTSPLSSRCNRNTRRNTNSCISRASTRRTYNPASSRISWTSHHSPSTTYYRIKMAFNTCAFSDLCRPFSFSVGLYIHSQITPEINIGKRSRRNQIKSPRSRSGGSFQAEDPTSETNNSQTKISD
jgi:hypothetical protein